MGLKAASLYLIALLFQLVLGIYHSTIRGLIKLVRRKVDMGHVKMEKKLVMIYRE